MSAVKGKSPVKEVPAMDTTETPEFNLAAGNLDFSDDAALQDEMAKTGGKFFDNPGNVDVVIVAADFHKNKTSGSIYCAKDPTWFNVKLTLQGPGEKEVNHWLQVPTTKIKYGANDTLAVFKNLQGFFFALGEEVTIKGLSALVQKYFKDPTKLVGTKLNVDLGFEGPYLATLEGTEDWVIMVKGKALSEDDVPVTYPAREAALNAAQAKGINPSFIRVLKFTAKKAAPKAAAKKAADEGW